jgi:hypothetical protein
MTPVILGIIVLLACIFTSFSILFHSIAAADAGMVCATPPDPRCISDVSQSNYSTVSTGIGFALVVLGQYYNRRNQASFAFFTLILLMLAAYAAISFLL